jgi:hypothetical protein
MERWRPARCDGRSGAVAGTITAAQVDRFTPPGGYLLDAVAVAALSASLQYRC